MRTLLSALAVTAGWLTCQTSLAQMQEANVLRPAWESLSEAERDLIRADHIVMVADPSDFGLIVDAQGVDQSTPGSNTGSMVGGAVGSVGYLNHALKQGNSYSPAKHLAFGLLGVLIGSAANADPVSRYQFRYALRMSDGEIITRDVIQSDPFRHSAGMCLSLSSVSPVSKAMCGQTADEIRAKYVKGGSANQSPQLPEAGPRDLVSPSTVVSDAPPVGGRVLCKLRNQTPVMTLKEQCELLGGISQ